MAMFSKINKDKQFKIRSSNLSRLLNADEKGLRKLYQEWSTRQLLDTDYNGYNANPAILKGLTYEDLAIELVFNGEAKKNQRKFENEWMTGTPDVIHNDTVYDIKNKFSYSGLCEVNKVPSNYYHQMQGYMALTNTTKATLLFVYINAPEFLVDDQAPEYEVKTFNVYAEENYIDKVKFKVKQLRKLI